MVIPVGSTLSRLETETEKWRGHGGREKRKKGKGRGRKESQKILEKVERRVLKRQR